MKNLLLSLSVLAVTTFSFTVFAEKKTFTDVLDREVSVDVPVKRPVLAFYYIDYLAIGGEKAMDNVVGFSKDVWTVWTPSSWDVFSEALPQLNDIADVGEVEAGTFSIEKVLSLKPDVLILADWQYQMIANDLTLIETAGIPVVVLDYNRESVERHVKSTQIIGELTGQNERANKIANEYKALVDEVAKRVKDSGKPMPSVYIEFGKGGPEDVGFTYGKDMWGALAALAHGDNIALPFVDKWAPMNPEQVIASNPDVIMIAGRETELPKNDYGMAIGINVPKEEAKRRLAGFKTRKGWSELSAIKNNRLYGLYQGASRTIADGAMVQFMAKQLYPELFTDIDPQATYLLFFKTYLPVVPEGSFMITVEE